MELSVTCSCGKKIVVTPASAGDEVRCPCGEIRRVPSLSELRRGAGFSSYDVGIADRIRQKLADGQLPTEIKCVNCGAETDGVLRCVVECERPWAAGGGFWKHFLLFLCAPVFLWGQLGRDYKCPEVLGRETVVKTPLRICAKCLTKLGEPPNARDLRVLLRAVALYDELLNEYPRATIHVSAE
jgi:hypothetical protein